MAVCGYITYYTIALALMLVCFVGFLGWKSYAWYGVIVYLGLNVVYNLYAVIMYALYMPDQMGAAIGQLLVVLTYAILVGIYYKKRRPLFFSNSIQVIADHSDSLMNEGQDNIVSHDAPPSIKYCRKCGYESLPESDFCSKCGTPVVKERYI